MSGRVPPSGQPAAPEPPSKGIEVGLIPFVASIVGVLLVIGIIGGVLWVTRDGEEVSSSTSTGAETPGGALSGRPTLKVSVEGNQLTWTMDYEGLREGDYFKIKTGGAPDAVTGDAVPLPRGETEYEQTIAPGVRQCGMVQVVRGGGTQTSGWSAVQCEETGS